MKILSKTFKTRDDLIEYVKSISSCNEGSVSPMVGGRHEAQKKLNQIDPIHYGQTRNFGDGKVTKLSPYIHHGVLSLNEVRNHALKKCDSPEQMTKFIQELAWRDFWQRVAEVHPEWLWHDVEAYKTGFEANDYADLLPEDIEKGNSGVASIDHFILYC